MISIAGLDKAAVLAALYNKARCLGMGFLHFVHGDMSVEEARSLIRDGDDHRRMFGQKIAGYRPDLYFDYLKGRVMKVDLGGDEFNPDLYDRDNGPGAAASALSHLRAPEPQP